jgi:hypothetical protein
VKNEGLFRDLDCGSAFFLRGGLCRDGAVRLQSALHVSAAAAGSCSSSSKQRATAVVCFLHFCTEKHFFRLGQDP